MKSQVELLDYFQKIASEVRNWVLETNFFNNPSLGGQCAICSFEIFKILKQEDLDPIFCLVSSMFKGEHCFVICQDFLIDITATQFHKLEKIYIRKLNKVDNDDRNWFWDYVNCKKLRKIEEIFEELKEWPQSQVPFLENYIYT